MNSEYVTRLKFEQYQKHMNTRFDNVDNSINELKELLNVTNNDLKDRIKNTRLETLEAVDSKIESSINKMKHTQTKWFIVTIIAISGLAGRIFGIY
ncbi:hypothetical protein [Staphylococcus kloosii]|uniref:Uncharacterized protein n=1 Tax=Staphylococcus kloosii TaxID=29384 RepID=A0A151A421_9STAP|nr:hypothetical protein [Staphylococcus kloosii]KYH14159.1 hypothetical protein A0131_05120 [Staphylococcus kloosii]